MTRAVTTEELATTLQDRLAIAGPIAIRDIIVKTKEYSLGILGTVAVQGTIISVSKVLEILLQRILSGNGRELYSEVSEF